MENQEDLTTCLDITFCGTKYCIEIPTDLNENDIQCLKSFISKALVTAKWSQFDLLVEETENLLQSAEMKLLFKQEFWFEILQIRNSVEPQLIDDVKKPEVQKDQESNTKNKWIKRGIYAAIGVVAVFGAYKYFKK